MREPEGSSRRPDSMGLADYVELFERGCMIITLAMQLDVDIVLFFLCSKAMPIHVT